MKTLDAYLFMNDEKETLLFVYLKMSKEQLQISLPISYEIDEKKNYLCVFIDKRCVACYARPRSLYRTWSCRVDHSPTVSCHESPRPPVAWE